MKVYVKKGDYSFILSIVLGIVFIGFAIGILLLFTKSERPFNELFAEFGIAIPFAFIFFIIGICIFVILFKPAKEYKLRLISKKEQAYNGMIITYMVFSGDKEKEVFDDLIDTDYKCYTIGQNDLVVNDDYSVKIKEFNCCPKYVEALNSCENNKTKDFVPMSISLITIPIVACGIIILLCIIGMIIYPKYILEYGIFGLIDSIILYRVIKKFKN